MKNQYIQMRCSTEDKERLKRKAEEMNISVSQYIWYCIAKEQQHSVSLIDGHID